MTKNDTSRARCQRRWPLWLMTGLVSALPLAGAGAQSYVIIDSTTPGVMVDHSVIDDLGPGRSGSGGTYQPGYSYGGGTGAPNLIPPGERPRSRLLAIPQLPDGAAPPPQPRVAPAPRAAVEPRPAPQPAPPPAAAPSPAAAPKAQVPPKPADKPQTAAVPPAPAPAPAPAQPQAAAPPQPPAPPPVPTPAPAPPPVISQPPPPPPPPSTPAAPPPVVKAPVTPPATPPVAANPPAPTAGDSGQQAALPKNAPAAGQLIFDGNSASLSDDARGALDKLAEQLKGNDKRLQVVAFATAQGQNASQARRLSLSRALAVRSYLIDKGIRSTRIDVRALGANEGSGPADRVDLVLANP